MKFVNSIDQLLLMLHKDGSMVSINERMHSLLTTTFLRTTSPPDDSPLAIEVQRLLWMNVIGRRQPPRNVLAQLSSSLKKLDGQYACPVLPCPVELPNCGLSYIAWELSGWNSGPLNLAMPRAGRHLGDGMRAARLTWTNFAICWPPICLDELSDRFLETMFPMSRGSSRLTVRPTNAREISTWQSCQIVKTR